MLSSIAALHRMAAAKTLEVRRTTILQRILNFLDIPIPETKVWETLENEPRTRAIEVLARLIVQTIHTKPKPERENE
jgi:hypothetical protein